MKIGLRGGHSPNCKGAFGILDEQVEVHNIYNAMVPLLHKLGHTVIDCNSHASDIYSELTKEQIKLILLDVTSLCLFT